MSNAIKQTRAEIAARKRLEKALAAFLDVALTDGHRAALGMKAGNYLSATVDQLRRVAGMLTVQAATEAAKRSPLIEGRYVDTLAAGLHDAMKHDTAAQWAHTSRDALHFAYMNARAAVLQLTINHPGSQKGRIVVDLRDRARMAPYTLDAWRKFVRGDA